MAKARSAARVATKPAASQPKTSTSATKSAARTPAANKPAAKPTARQPVSKPEKSTANKSATKRAPHKPAASKPARTPTKTAANNSAAKPSAANKPAVTKTAPSKSPAKRAVAREPSGATKPTKPKRLTKEQAEQRRAELHRLTSAAISADKIDEAVVHIGALVALASSKKQRQRAQQIALAHGHRYLGRQKWKEAAALYEAGLPAFKAGDDTQITAELLSEGGFCALQLHDLETAGAKIRRSLELHDEAKRADGAANAIYYLSNVVFEQGKIDDAIALGREAVKRSADAGNVRGETFHAYALARALYEKGHSREAEQVATSAIEKAKSMGLVAVEGNLENMLANVMLDDARLVEAKQHYERAIELFRQASLQNHEAITISNLGNLAWDEGRLEDALDNYARAVELHGEVKDDRSTAIGLTARAGVKTELGRFDEAHADLERALAVMMQKGHERRVSFVRAAFAKLAETRGELAEARAHYAETEMSLETAGDSVEVGRMLYAAAGVEAELGDPESAMQMIERAAALDPSSAADHTRPGEQRAGTDTVRALRALALARVEVAKANRASGDEARAFRAAATARLQAIVHAKDSLVDRNCEVRRVVGRLTAQLGTGAPVMPATRFRGSCTSTGWKAELTGELLVSVERGEMIATGTLAWNDRTAEVTVRGPDLGEVRHLRGTMVTVTDPARWQLRAEIELAGKALRGRIFEVLEEGGEDEMCTFDWRQV